LGDAKVLNEPDWERRLSDCLPLFGHRNWIVVADSAYPAQSSPGIETLVAPASQIEVVHAVVEAISASKHVKALVHLDREITYVSERDASGIAAYRRQLEGILSGVQVDWIPHEEIISRLDQSARVFRILIIKTPMTIPYTSVFFELDCRYWSAEAEQRLRKSMQVQ
jgi:D-ribose pyranose/furanose isomerase RbsD